MWYISAVLLWSFFMAIYHSIPLIWVGILLLCYSMHWSSSSGPFHTQTHTRQLASWKISTHPSRIFPLNLQNISQLSYCNLHPWTVLSEGDCSRQPTITDKNKKITKNTFSQLLESGFGCRVLVLVQWFVFTFWSFDDHNIFFLHLCLVKKTLLLNSAYIYIYILEDHFAISMATKPSVQR